MIVVPIATCAIVGIASIIVTPFLMRRQSVRKKYANMAKHDLLYAKVNAERMWKFSLAIIILAPIPISFMFPLLPTPQGQAVLACAMILLIMGGIASFSMWWEIVTITKAELEYRDRKKDDEA